MGRESGKREEEFTTIRLRSSYGASLLREDAAKAGQRRHEWGGEIGRMGRMGPVSADGMGRVGALSSPLATDDTAC